jgi:hypothetical protein
MSTSAFEMEYPIANSHPNSRIQLNGRFSQSHLVVEKTAHHSSNMIPNREQDFFIKTYPFILGADVAGYVEDIGEGVTHVQKGQRVMGYKQLLHPTV